ncbi:MAG: amidohydrolase family protein [Treponema sp.]|jgi:guanine deaminase|nr:amidohydrolase family protein [Treponema sp.]
MNSADFVLKGDICFCENSGALKTLEGGFLVCRDGKSAGAFPRLPEEYASLLQLEYTGKLIIPGLTDLHTHAPQYGFRALGMNLELLEWLETRTFPEEARYGDIEYARRAYTRLVEDLKKGPNTRFCFFATVHVPATLLLMDLLEKSGLVSFAGKVNMDRNCPESLREAAPGKTGAEVSLAATREWIKRCGNYQNTRPILTPRFIPACTGELFRGLAEIQKAHALPLQSHLSENKNEIAWVRELCPESAGYGDAYARRDLFGGDVPTIMAHCVWSDEDEIQLLAKRGVFAAHCPQSNINLSSGIAPVRRLLEAGVPVGLGSDVAGGVHASIFRAMTDAIQVSKLRRVLLNTDEAALTLEEAFYLGTAGGGAFFGKAGGFGPSGSFDPGFDFDAVIVNDAGLAGPAEPIRDRLERVVYLSDDRHIEAKYVRGKRIL